MGNNSAYTAFESITINAYNQGKIDRWLMSTIMNAWRNSDIDSGGSMGLLTCDGKNVEQVVIEVMGETFPKRPNVPEDYAERTKKQDEMHDRWLDRVDKKFRKITGKFGWW